MSKNLIVALLICLSFQLLGQGIKFNVGIPVLSHNLTSVDEIANGANNDYFNNIWLPNLRIGMSYKSVYFGIDTYSARILTIKDLEYRDGVIGAVSLESYSFLLGYQKDVDKVKFRAGSGVTFNDDSLGYYTDFRGGFESFPCYESNPWSFIFWSSIDYAIWNKVTVGINLRFNPMLQEFNSGSIVPCFNPHGHDRIHYFVSQLIIGYSF